MERKHPVIDMKKTGQNIKWIMRRSGLNVKDVQEYLGLSTPQSIYHWFDGRNLPTIDNLYALSELFHVPVDAFLKGNRRYDYGSAEQDRHQHIIMYYEKILQLRAG